MRMNIGQRLVQPVVWTAVVVGIGLGAYYSRDNWLPLINGKPAEVDSSTGQNAPPTEAKTLTLSPQARANLSLNTKPASPQSYWKKIEIPGVIVDRPGFTDRGVTSPVSAVVTQVHAFEGDIIQPGERLFTLRLVSEYLHQTQLDLYKAIRETEILNQEAQRIGSLVAKGVVSENRVIELNQQVSRQAALIDAQRQDLLSRGLLPEQIGKIETGEFLTNIDVFAPDLAEKTIGTNTDELPGNTGAATSRFFEIQNLNVDLGQQVDAGEVLAVLANHNSLYIRGHAFKKEASSLAHAAENTWAVNVGFTEDTADAWPPLDQTFEIRHLANTTDPASRTFDFFIPLQNQSREYKKGNRPFVVWRFRPGQRVIIQVPVEELKNVLILPAAAVVREGPEAYVFQQNGDLFNRIPVQVVHQDRSNIVLANDGSITPGFYLAQGSAASLNRVLKAQSASGMQPGIHVHADGTTHAAH